uniref:Uncharacterized protein n=1 Tax=Candidatus Kentrum sp. LFY TaxID=2126342 RepID=A0A450U6S3_9GAMM|nr:MAG: hypothetical protein BECKLFY1418A_GA0070994_100176 [Candidatus Kentron sp. LFY]
MNAYTLGFFSLVVVLIWFAWGGSILRFFARAKKEYKNKCIEKIIQDQIKDGYESTLRSLLFLVPVIAILYLLPSLNFSDLLEAILSKGVKSGNVFAHTDMKEVLALPAVVVLLSLVWYVVKFRVITKAISCLEHIDVKIIEPTQTGIGT